MWLKKSVKLLKWQSVLVTSFLLYLSIPSFFFTNIGTDLDSSWKAGLNLVINKGLVFGDEIVFTFGPLGYLSTRYPAGISLFNFLWFDIFIFTNLWFLFYAIIKDKIDAIKVVVILGLVLSFSTTHKHNFFYNEVGFLNGVLIIFWATSLFTQSYASFIKYIIVFNIILLSTVSLFIKLNFGLIGLLLTLFFLIILYLSQKINVKELFTFMAVIVITIALLSVVLHVNFLNYFINSLSIISSYNDAMFIRPEEYSRIYIFIGIVITVSILIGLNIFKIWADKTSLIQYCFVGFCEILFLYLIFKQCFTRADESHYTYMYYAIPVLLSVFTFTNHTYVAQYSHYAAIFVVSIILFFVFSNDISFDKTPNIKKIAGYVSKYKTYQKFEKNNLGRFIPLSNSTLSYLYKGSVDIFPYDIYYAAAYQLRYNPRPIFQTYSAYNQALDSINAHKIQSNTAPDFILFSNKWHKEERLAFHEETFTKLALMANYSIISIEKSKIWPQYIVLGRDKEPKKYRLHLIKKNSVNFGENLYLGEHKSLVLGKFKITYTLWGKLIRLLFQPPRVTYTLGFADGHEQQHTAIVPNLENGIFVNRYITNSHNTEELITFFESFGTQTVPVTQIKFDVDWIWGVEKQIQYSLEEVVKE